MQGNYIRLKFFLFVFFFLNSALAFTDTNCEMYSHDDCAICCSIPVASVNEDDKYYVVSENKDHERPKVAQVHKRSTAIHENKVGSAEKKLGEAKIESTTKKTENETASECLKKCTRRKKTKN